MSLAFERMVAGRYLRSKRKEGFISVIAGFSFLGIMLGVATLIIVMAVMNGFKEELISRILGLNGHVLVYSRSGPMFPYEPLIKQLEKIPNVLSVIPTVEGQSLLSSQNNATGVMIRGIRPQDIEKKPLLAKSFEQKMADGDYFGGEKVAIGYKLAEKLRIGLGDKIVLISPKGKTTPFGTIPRSRAFIVGGIYNVGMYEYDAAFVFMPLDMATTFLDMGEGITGLEIDTPNPATVEGVKEAVQKSVSVDFAVSDWRDSNESFATAIEVQRNVLFLILTLIIIVAAFNIISSLIMLVKDKGRDIAILRTMGATRGMIVRIFLFTGSLIGITGTTAGAILGVVFAKNIESIRQWLQGLTGTDLFAGEIYFLSQLPAKMDTGEVITIVLMALGLSFAATIYPAWKAAKLDPVEGLRRE